MFQLNEHYIIEYMYFLTNYGKHYIIQLYRAFHNVLRDYKNRRTRIY